MKVCTGFALVSALLAILTGTASSRSARRITCPAGAPAGVVAAGFLPSGDRVGLAHGTSIHVMTLGGRVVARRKASAIPTQMAWGPQGLAVAYVGGDGNELHLLDGGDVVLFRAPAALELGGWIRDGTSLVVSTSATGLAGTAKPEAYVVSSSGTRIRDLGPGSHAVPSPDGRRVAVVVSSADARAAEIQVIDLATDARTTIFRAQNDVIAPAALVPALAWSPDSRQIAFLWNIDVEPELLAQNADGSSTGLFGREHGALPTEIGMTGPFRWTKHGIVGEALSGDGGSFIAFYNTQTGKERGVGLYQYRAQLLDASLDGAHVVYNAIGPEGTLTQAGLRIADWPGTHDRPFLPCNGTVHADRVTASPEPTTINTGGGNDVVVARNHRRDVIDCGPGVDTAFVERRDVVRRCEHVHRVSG